MFLQECVISFVRRGMGGWLPSMHHWSHDQGGLHPGVGGFCMGRGVGRADPPRDTTGYGQRVGGTHPTGMHSCLVNNCAVQKMNANVHVLINHLSTRHLAKQLKL